MTLFVFIALTLTCAFYRNIFLFMHFCRYLVVSRLRTAHFYRFTHSVTTVLCLISEMFFGTRRIREIRSRMQWPKQLSLVFAMMGYCVGLANLLMFSYKAAQGGGGLLDKVV